MPNYDRDIFYLFEKSIKYSIIHQLDKNIRNEIELLDILVHFLPVAII